MKTRQISFHCHTNTPWFYHPEVLRLQGKCYVAIMCVSRIMCFLYCIVWAFYTANIGCCVSKLCAVDVRKSCIVFAAQCAVCVSIVLYLHYCQRSVSCVLVLHCISTTANVVWRASYSCVACMCVCTTASIVCCACEFCIVFALLPA